MFCLETLLEFVTVIYAILFWSKNDLPLYVPNASMLESSLLFERDVYGDASWVRLLILDEIQLNTEYTPETELWFMQERTRIIWEQ